MVFSGWKILSVAKGLSYENTSQANVEHRHSDMLRILRTHSVANLGSDRIFCSVCPVRSRSGQKALTCEREAGDVIPKRWLRIFSLVSNTCNRKQDRNWNPQLHLLFINLLFYVVLLCRNTLFCFSQQTCMHTRILVTKQRTLRKNLCKRDEACRTVREPMRNDNVHLFTSEHNQQHTGPKNSFALANVLNKS